MARVLFHIDLNAFFASAEELKDPSLKGHPMAVGSDSRRSVISTANYAARKLGIHSAMPVYEALKICPELKLVKGDYTYYRALSSRFFAYLKQYTQQIEPASIDECYMDVTEIIGKYKRPLDLAFQVQNGIHDTIGLDVSIGVGPNRFLAKMASDMRKPRGITILRKSEIERKLWPLPIDNMIGIGQKTIPILKKHQIETIGDFANVDNEAKILSLLGKNVYTLIQKARGFDRDQLNYSSSRKSLSCSKTFQSDIYTLEEAIAITKRMVYELCLKMRQEHQKGKLVSLTLRDLDFHTIVRSFSFDHYIDDYPLFMGAIENLLEQNFKPIGYRHIGITIGSLQDKNHIIRQEDLFTVPIEDTQSIVEQLNSKFDQTVFMKASDLLKKE